MDQIELARGDDKRAVAIDPADLKTSFAQARAVIDEWEHDGVRPIVAEEQKAQADSAVAAAETALEAAKARQARVAADTKDAKKSASTREGAASASAGRKGGERSSKTPARKTPSKAKGKRR